MRWLCLLMVCALLGSAPVAIAQALAETEAVPEAAGEEAQTPLSVDAAPDEKIEQRLQGVFSRVEAFDQIQVDVQEGVVYLTGSVQRAEAREKAERFALRLEGVLFVANEVVVQTDVEARVTPAIVRLRSFVKATIGYLPVLGLSLGLIVAAYLLARLVTWSDRPFHLLGINPLLANLLRRMIVVAIVLAGLFVAIDILDITALAGAAIGAAGVVGLALGFAFRDIAENYLAGILMSVRRPFGIGDFVRIDTHEGHIVRLTARELVLITLDGNHVRLPNSMVFKAVIYNFSTNPQRQFQVDVGLGTDADLVAAQAEGVRTLAKVPGVLAQPGPFARVQELAASSVVVRFFGWVDQRETGFFVARSEAVRRLKEAFDAGHFSVPAPHYTVALQRPGPSRPTPPRAPTEPQPTDRGNSEEAVVDRQIRQDITDSRERNLLEEAD